MHVFFQIEFPKIPDKSSHQQKHFQPSESDIKPHFILNNPVAIHHLCRPLGPTDWQGHFPSQHLLAHKVEQVYDSDLFLEHQYKIETQRQDSTESNIRTI